MSVTKSNEKYLKILHDEDGEITLIQRLSDGKYITVDINNIDEDINDSCDGDWFEAEEIIINEAIL